MEIPIALKELPVFLAARRLGEDPQPSSSRPTDNSNTQFALLGLWVAHRHKVAVEPALEISTERFERLQVFPYGIWPYSVISKSRGTSQKSMTCVGVMALDIGRALKLPTPGSPAKGKKDVHTRAARLGRLVETVWEAAGAHG